jgi:hypothetical protein
MNTHCATCARIGPVDAFYLCWSCAGNENLSDVVANCVRITTLAALRAAVDAVRVDDRCGAVAALRAVERAYEREAAASADLRCKRAQQAMVRDQERKAS